MRISVASRDGLDHLKVVLWHHLQLVRVYAKPPGKPVRLIRYATHRDEAEDIAAQIAPRIQGYGATSSVVSVGFYDSNTT